MNQNTFELFATRSYVNNNFLLSDGSNKMNGNINMNQNTITIEDSKELNDNDAVNKKYVNKMLLYSLPKGDKGYKGSTGIVGTDGDKGDKGDYEQYKLLSAYVGGIGSYQIQTFNPNLLQNLDIDMNGKNILNLGNAIENGDAITYGEVNNILNNYLIKIRSIKQKLFSGVPFMFGASVDNYYNNGKIYDPREGSE
jgi:hypothetical protein